MLTLAQTHVPISARRRSRGFRALANCTECPVRPASICSVLDRHELSEFERMGQEATFPPRSTIFAEGERVKAVYNLTAGLARLYRLLPGGQRQIVGFALPGDFLGLPPGAHHSFSADTAVTTTACRFPRQPFVAFAESHNLLLRKLHHTVAGALDLAHDQMVQLGPRRADAKVAAFILGMRRRWARLCGTEALVPLPMGRQDIGDYLGLSIATVSRTLTRLDRERVILVVPKGIRILELGRLEQLASI